jgi:DNA-binding transcriptional LysR family regulator
MDEPLPTQLLRSFLLLTRSKSFTRTAEQVGRTQSAISVQLRRLEELVGTTLVDRTSRRFRLTAKGERLAVYAQRILDLNDRCLAELSERPLTGRLRIGIPSDFAASHLPQVLARFTASYPEVSLEVIDDLSTRLIARRQDEALDLVLALTDGQADAAVIRTWREPVVWVGSALYDLSHRDPLPLVVHPEGCRYRAYLLAALSAADRAARLIYVSTSLAGIEAAVGGGLGVTALSRSTLPASLVALGESRDLPALGSVEVGLFAGQARASKAGRALSDYLCDALDSRLTPVEA